MFLDYADAARAAFIDAGGYWAKMSGVMSTVVNIFLILTQVGSNAVYVLFIAQNLQPVRKFISRNLELGLASCLHGAKSENQRPF